MNGARGYVQAIEVSKETGKVDVIWIVFNNTNIGNLYRFDHRHLKKKNFIQDMIWLHLFYLKGETLKISLVVLNINELIFH